MVAGACYLLIYQMCAWYAVENDISGAGIPALAIALNAVDYPGSTRMRSLELAAKRDRTAREATRRVHDVRAPALAVRPRAA